MNRRDFLKTTIGGLLAGIGLKFGIDKLKPIEPKCNVSLLNKKYPGLEISAIKRTELEIIGEWNLNDFMKNQQFEMVIPPEFYDKWHHLVFEKGKLTYMDGKKV